MFYKNVFILYFNILTSMTRYARYNEAQKAWDQGRS